MSRPDKGRGGVTGKGDAPFLWWRQDPRLSWTNFRTGQLVLCNLCRKWQHDCHGLHPSNHVKLKHATWNLFAPMQNSCLLCFTIWTSLLLGHLQSQRLFLHCGAGCCMRCFMAGTWICSHSGGMWLVPVFAHVWMTWGPGHFMENMPCAVVKDTVTWRPGFYIFLSYGILLTWNQ